MELFGLQTASLNGVVGVVTSGPIDGRVGVDLGSHGVKSVKVVNLRVVKDVEKDFTDNMTDTDYKEWLALNLNNQDEKTDSLPKDPHESSEDDQFSVDDFVRFVLNYIHSFILICFKKI